MRDISRLSPYRPPFGCGADAETEEHWNLGLGKEEARLH